jgi:hypothetical protein
LSTSKVTGKPTRVYPVRYSLSHSKPTKGWELPEQQTLAVEATSTTRLANTSRHHIITQVGSV